MRQFCNERREAKSLTIEIESNFQCDFTADLTIFLVKSILRLDGKQDGNLASARALAMASPLGLLLHPLLLEKWPPISS